MSLTELKREISALSAEARAELAAFLCELDDTPLASEWPGEIKSRIQEIQTGSVQTISHDAMMRELRVRYQ